MECNSVISFNLNVNCGNCLENQTNEKLDLNRETRQKSLKAHSTKNVDGRFQSKSMNTNSI